MRLCTLCMLPAAGHGGGIAISIPSDVQGAAEPAQCASSLPNSFWPYSHAVSITLTRVRLLRNSVALLSWSYASGGGLFIGAGGWVVAGVERHTRVGDCYYPHGGQPHMCIDSDASVCSVHCTVVSGMVMVAVPSPARSQEGW
jgi:hypothetical protein